MRTPEVSFTLHKLSMRPAQTPRMQLGADASKGDQLENTREAIVECDSPLAVRYGALRCEKDDRSKPAILFAHPTVQRTASHFRCALAERVNDFAPPFVMNLLRKAALISG